MNMSFHRVTNFRVEEGEKWDTLYIEYWAWGYPANDSNDFKRVRHEAQITLHHTPEDYDDE